MTVCNVSITQLEGNASITQAQHNASITHAQCNVSIIKYIKISVQHKDSVMSVWHKYSMSVHN